MNWMRDPTAETAGIKRARVQPLPTLDGKTVALFDIGKARTEEFLNYLEEELGGRGIRTRRFGKPTNAKVATTELIQKVATEADAVIIALSD